VHQHVGRKRYSRSGCHSPKEIRTLEHGASLFAYEAKLPLKVVLAFAHLTHTGLLMEGATPAVAISRAKRFFSSFDFDTDTKK
jgi:hypothetical protein